MHRSARYYWCCPDVCSSGLLLHPTNNATYDRQVFIQQLPGVKVIPVVTHATIQNLKVADTLNLQQFAAFDAFVLQLHDPGNRAPAILYHRLVKPELTADHVTVGAGEVVGEFVEAVDGSERVLELDVFAIDLLQFAQIAFVELVEQVAELRSEEHTSELQSRPHLVCRLLL